MLRSRIALAIGILVAAGMYASQAAAQTSVNGQIAFTVCEPGPFDSICDIWVMNPDGSDQQNITNTPDVNEADPAWSPDGTRIAYVEGDIGFNRLMVVNADGSGRSVGDRGAVESIRPHVLSGPVGILCGPDCENTYAAGTLVRLLAFPNRRSFFAGWSGACTGRSEVEAEEAPGDQAEHIDDERIAPNQTADPLHPPRDAPTPAAVGGRPFASVRASQHPSEYSFSRMGSSGSGYIGAACFFSATPCISPLTIRRREPYHRSSS
jgi:hypothetical protein